MCTRTRDDAARAEGATIVDRHVATTPSLERESSPSVLDALLPAKACADHRTRRWWATLYLISAGNVGLWIAIAWLLPSLSDAYVAAQLALSGVYVAACAFRAVVPRVDLERQCLWNTPLSSIFVGRSVATIAEMCFAAQCALLVLKLSALTGYASLEVIGWSIVPLIAVAQLACWHAVVSLNHIGHAIEEILWSVMVFLVAVSLGAALEHLSGAVKLLGLLGIVACSGAALLMLAVDVPMYLARWKHSRARRVRFLPVLEGLKDAHHRRRVTHGWSAWRPEVPWMSLYFTVGVWISLGLVFV